MALSLSSIASPSQLLPLWQVLKRVPGGGVVMGRLAGRMAPYTGTIRPEVLTLEKGYARIRMRDTRRVRNHLNSVHAIALMNLGEVSTGMAVITALPEGMRGIISRLSMDYLKKGRGPLVAECSCPPITSTEKQDLEVTAELKNDSGEVVAIANAKWRVGA